MAKITSTGKQFVITLPKDILESMGWNKETEVIISKYPDKDRLFIEQIKKKKTK